VVDDELAAVVEQLGERSPPIGRVEDVVLLHADPRQARRCRVTTSRMRVSRFSWSSRARRAVIQSVRDAVCMGKKVHLKV
jgi:hypothetical protein